MSAEIYVAENWQAKAAASPPDRTVALESDGYYWHLYRFFEGANLHEQPGELIDLYGENEIDGYQLDRLEDELRAALEDAARRPEQWPVLTGWIGNKCRANETWKTIERERLVEIVERLLWLIAFAREQRLKLVVFGD